MIEQDRKKYHMCIQCNLYEFCVEEYGITSECLSCDDFERTEG